MEHMVSGGLSRLQLSRSATTIMDTDSSDESALVSNGGRTKHVWKEDRADWLLFLSTD